ncbi:helix-turn-helix domain-containing protein [Cellulomonas cellasea]|uniref:TetR/AcrR family transcriptional regulator n=1 Tax=Cellulomonas cellasea TaxID=43670 RepID=UPI0025A3737F|nr:TetR/AcrR family transcriptional regulator [Cellulomonas cellasea]MDM8085755.1 helix-turn-helix domain-containing protein [Cellulomonas cellasea]
MDLKQRMTAEERREQILDAALAVFAEGGYAGTTTDQVARAAGVSQPYVVRVFGTKQQLFRELYTQAVHRVVETLAAVRPGPDAKVEMGEAYVALLADRNLLRVVMHGFASPDPEVGRLARGTLGAVFRLFRERTGADEHAAESFVAQGLLINVLLMTSVPDHLGEDAAVDALAACVLDPRMTHDPARDRTAQ